MMTAVETDRLLTRAEAADYLNVQPQTLAAWKCRGRYGLPVIKLGRSIRYRQSDLDRWLAQRTVVSGTCEIE